MKNCKSEVWVEFVSGDSVSEASGRKLRLGMLASLHQKMSCALSAESYEISTMTVQIPQGARRSTVR